MCLRLAVSTAKDASAATYDGDAPRELMRMEQPFGNHNGGQIAFNPLAAPGSDDYGNLYISNGITVAASHPQFAFFVNAVRGGFAPA